MKLKSTEAAPQSPAIQALFQNREASWDVDSREAVDSVLLINRSGAIVRANASALALFGCVEGEMIGAFYGQFFSTFDVDCASRDDSLDADPIFRCLLEGCPCFSIFGLTRSPNGAMNSIDGCIAPFYDENRDVGGAVMICRSLDN